MKSCPISGEFDRSTGSNPLLSGPIPLLEVVGLTIDRCITSSFSTFHANHILVCIAR